MNTKTHEILVNNIYKYKRNNPLEYENKITYLKNITSEPDIASIYVYTTTGNFDLFLSETNNNITISVAFCAKTYSTKLFDLHYVIIEDNTLVLKKEINYPNSLIIQNKYNWSACRKLFSELIGIDLSLTLVNSIINIKNTR